jgi:hypothetical protein
MTKDTGKPHPIVFDDVEPMPEIWQTIGSLMVGVALAGLAVFFALVFFTGLWVWSLLI